MPTNKNGKTIIFCNILLSVILIYLMMIFQMNKNSMIRNILYLGAIGFVLFVFAKVNRIFEKMMDMIKRKNELNGEDPQQKKEVNS